MTIHRKPLLHITLGLGVAVMLAADSADARGRGGSSRGRSGGFSRSSSSRSSSSRGSISRGSIQRGTSSRSPRTSQFLGRTRTSNSRVNNTRINNTRTNNTRINNSRTRIGSNRRGNTRQQKVSTSLTRHRHPGHNHHGHGHHKHGHHHHHGYHHHHHWGGWHGKGHHGWGVGIYHRHRYFNFAFIAPVRSYCNPYCEAPGFLPEDGPEFDNSQALQTQGGQGQQSEKGMELLMAASEAFTKGDLQTAMTNADAAAREMKNFPEVHQFRSLILFAMGKYGESASAAHVGLTAGKGWNWTTLKSFYPDVAVYTAQLRNLEAAVKDNPKNPGGHFLLAYHYLMMGHGPAAVAELRSVVELEPKDELSARMLKAVSSKLGQSNDAKPAPQDNKVPETQDGPDMQNGPGMQDGPGNNQPMNEQPEQVEQPAISLNPIGVWKATRDDGLLVTLTMTKEGKFDWNALMKDRTIKFDGQFVLAAGELKLTRSQDNNSLDGIVSVISKDKFSMRIKGRDENDPGLTFERN